MAFAFIDRVLECEPGERVVAVKALALNEEYFRDHFRAFSPHTNYEMASLSLLGVVGHLEEIFAAVDWAAVNALPPVPRPPKPNASTADPLDDIEIPEV